MSDGSFNRIVDFAVIPGTNNTEAIVVSQKDERILRVSLTGAFAPTVYGDLSGYVGGGGSEEGLLSATFSPDFANDRRIYVYYTQGAPSPTVLSRFQVPGDTIDTGNETRILEVPGLRQQSQRRAASSSGRTAICTSRSATEAAGATRRRPGRTSTACSARCCGSR